MNQKELEAKILEASDNRKDIETRLKNTQQSLLRMQESFEDDLAQLKAAQTNENNLQEELYNLQKQQIKEVMSVDSLKKVIGDTAPFFMRLKEKTLNKVQEVKEFLDGTNLENQWLQDKYDEYKDICIQKGEEIKSKEEFQKIALAIKESENLGETSIYEKVAKISKEVGSAKETIKNVLQTLKVEEKITNIFKGTEGKNQQEVVVNKKQVFQEWFEKNNIALIVEQQESPELYQNYQEYLGNTYGQDNTDKLSYSFRNGNFTNMLNKSVSSANETVEPNKRKRKM